MGLMWFDALSETNIGSIRHFVEMHDKVSHYGWKSYDPRIGGVEEIIDPENNLNLTITFMKSRDGLNWISRVHGKKLDPKRDSTGSMVLYLDQQISDANSKSMLKRITEESSNNITYDGYSTELGKYKVQLNDVKGSYYDSQTGDRPFKKGVDASKTSEFSLLIPNDNYWKADQLLKNLYSDTVTGIMQAIYRETTEEGRAKYEIDSVDFPDVLQVRNLYDFEAGNFHLIQKTFDLTGSKKEFEFDVIYNAENSSEKITSETAEALITAGLNEIDSKFNRKFSMGKKDKDKTQFVKSTLSDLLGGIGYFYGNQIVDRETVLDERHFDEIKLEHPQEEGPYGLFTAVPSRSQFPRGFYWDEGFHLLQIMEYDFDLAFDIISSWFNLIEKNSGWIAREVILGDEARSRVPEEFTTQNPNIANPPTLLLAFGEMLKRAIENFDMDSDEIPHDSIENNKEFLIKYSKQIYPKLVKHYKWFLNSQNINADDDYEEIFEDINLAGKVHTNNLYAWVGRTFTHCLPSGLDDYPRAQPPSTSELHVDALSWVGVMARSLKQIASILGRDKDALKYEETEKNVIDNLLNLHWSEKDKCFCDVTVDTYGDNLIHVCHEGYISLLPFALKLIPADSDKLDHVLKLMSDKKKIFSRYGLLSLSKKDKYYGTDENYWRGPIWMNINYLCLDALRFYFPQTYSKKPTSIKISRPKKTVKTAVNLFNSLKSNLVTNVFKEWKNKGYCYENYNPETGEGSGARQFTGWTSLIVNIIGKF